MTSLQVTLASLAVIALGGSSLAAKERRADACYLIETMQVGHCEYDAVAMCNKIKGRFGCPGEVTAATCYDDDEYYHLRCDFPS